MSLSRDDLVTGARFLTTVPRIMRNPVTVAEARDELHWRLAERGQNFLALVRAGAYGAPASPYRRLLQMAGCEYPDLEHLVKKEGLEVALYELFRQGVYLTVDEAKGRQPIVRGSTTFSTSTRELRNPLAAQHLASQSSGSRGRRTESYQDLTTTREHAAEDLVSIEAHGTLDSEYALWAVPGSAAMGQLLKYRLCRLQVARWFSPTDLHAPSISPRYRWSTYALRLGGALGGVTFPAPQYVPLTDPLPIARWMQSVLRRGRAPYLYGYVSAAVQLARVACEAGIDLTGGKMEVGGEPVTSARVIAIHRSGAEVIPRYGSTETGGLGRGCMAPATPDDLHLLQERVAVIQPGEYGAAANLPARALLVTPLHLHHRLVLINASMGDQAELDQRRCGCPLEQLGWTTHVHAIRSFEKLTAGGMTFYDAEVIQILDEILPARFGGGATDYQLVDEECPDGSPQVRLLVHPRLGPLDEHALRQTFLNALSQGAGPDAVMAGIWRDGGFVQVSREPPRTTTSGKIQHVHLAGPQPESE